MATYNFSARTTAINFRGTPGNDSIIGGAGNDTLDGGAGNDTLDGGPGADLLLGGSGDDVLRDRENVEPGQRDDTLNGGLGNDTYDIRADPFREHRPVLIDSGGYDTVLTNHDHTLAAGFEKLVLFEGVIGRGNSLNNVIITNTNEPHAYFVDGADGNDTLIGGADQDTFQFSAGSGYYGNDVVDGNGGIDTLDFSGGRSAVVVNMQAGTARGGGTNGSGTVAFSDIEVVQGTRFNDQLSGGGQQYGGRGSDTLIGGAGNDRLFADNTLTGFNTGAGNDRLSGRGGNDFLEGGAGADSFVFEVAPGAANADTVADFVSGVDRLLLDDAAHRSIGPTGRFAAGDDRFFAGAGVSAGQDREDRVVYDTSSGNLYYDADGSGSGAALLIASFIDAPRITATDITVF